MDEVKVPTIPHGHPYAVRVCDHSEEVRRIAWIKADVKLALSACTDYRREPALGLEVIRHLLMGALRR